LKSFFKIFNHNGGYYGGYYGGYPP